jgi:hypothetical protein
LALLALALADIGETLGNVAAVNLPLSSADLVGSIVLLVTAALALAWAA